MFKKQLKFIITIILVLGFSISLQSLIAAWQEPSLSPPGGNIDKPINESVVKQEKLGSFDVGGSMGIGADMIVDRYVAINSATSTYRLRLLDDVGGPDIYIQGLGVNPELALGNNSNYWSIYSDETNSDELRFWRGDNNMALTDSGTLKIKEICDEDGNNCVDVSDGIGGGVPKDAVVAFASTTCPTDWQIADGTNGTPDLRGRFIRGLDSGGSSNDPDSRSLGSYQADEIKSHSHGLSAGTVSRASGSGSHGGNVHSSNSGLYTDAYGGDETRPKNIALTYCVKMTDTPSGAGGGGGGGGGGVGCSWEGWKCSCSDDSDGSYQGKVVVGIQCLSGVISDIKASDMRIRASSVDCPSVAPLWCDAGYNHD